MSLRGKIFSSMFILIVLIASVFFIMSKTYMQSVFERYTSVVKLGEAQQWASLLGAYYTQNGNSWSNVEAYVDRVEHNRLSASLYTSHESLAITDIKRNTIFISQSDGLLPTDVFRIGIPVPVIANRKTVAIVYVSDRGLDRLYRLQQRILSSMTKAILYGVAITVAAALLLALWLTRITTKPLQQLVRAIREMTRGNLRPTLSISSGDEFGQVALAFNQMSAKLSAAEEGRRRLVADVAHELRTPLTIMQGQLELIQRGVLKADLETLLPISDECIRLTRLVEDLHQLSQAEAGVLHLERETTDLMGLLERIVDNFQYEAEDNGVTFLLLPEAPLPDVFVDPRRLTQVFINILGNAMRYTPRDGRITIRLSQSGRFVRVAIQDTGPGIPKDHLPNLFNRFYRVDPDRSRVGGGMGLGLAIAKEFVEAHHGFLEVESEVGEGTTFTVGLPVEDHESRLNRIEAAARA